MTYIEFLESLPKIPDRFSVEPSEAERSAKIESFWQNFLNSKKIFSDDLAKFDDEQKVLLYVEFSFAVMKKAQEE